MLKRFWTLLIALCLTGGLITFGPLSEAAAAVGPGLYQSMIPRRIVDTRAWMGGGRLAPGATLTVPVVSWAALGATSAVVVNLTVTNPQTAGFITAWPSDQPKPNASNVNFRAGQTTANLAVVKVGSDGQIKIANSSGGSVDVIVDVLGSYAGGGATVTPGAFVPLAQPTRFIDTRTGLGMTRMAPFSQVTIRIPQLPLGASAVVFNLTATNTQTAGYLRVGIPGQPLPNVSNINFVAGETKPNLVTVGNANGAIVIANTSSGWTDVVADMAGYYLGGPAATVGAFVPVAPYRAFDSRTDAFGKVGPMMSRWVKLPAGADTAVTNLTATEPEYPGYLSMSAGVGTSSSNVNFGLAETNANHAYVSMDKEYGATVTNVSSGRTHVVVDVFGYFLGSPTQPRPDNCPNGDASGNRFDTSCAPPGAPYLGPITCYHSATGTAVSVTVYDPRNVGYTLTLSVNGIRSVHSDVGTQPWHFAVTGLLNGTCAATLS